MCPPPSPPRKARGVWPHREPDDMMVLEAL